jgi:phage terminase large subunit-like protein
LIFTNQRDVVITKQALLAWAVSNARVEPKGNAIVITKQASGAAKIDPLMAALMRLRGWRQTRRRRDPASL